MLHQPPHQVLFVHRAHLEADGAAGGALQVLAVQLVEQVAQRPGAVALGHLVHQLLQRRRVLLQGEGIHVGVQLHLRHIALVHPLIEGGVGNRLHRGALHPAAAHVQHEYQHHRPQHDAEKAQRGAFFIIAAVGVLPAVGVVWFHWAGHSCSLLCKTEAGLRPVFCDTIMAVYHIFPLKTRNLLNGGVNFL